MAASKSSKSNSVAKRILAEFMHVVRGPFFLCGVSLVLVLAIPASQATLLKGYVSTSPAAPNTTPAAIAADSSPVPGLLEDESPAQAPAGPDAAFAAQTPALATSAESAMQQRAERLRALVAQNSFPVSFAGTWRVVTLVVDSAVPSVPIGQRVESQVWFVPLHNGRIVARWSQPGWTEAQENIMLLSDHEAEMERTNYFIEEGPYGWAAHSKDHYLQISAAQMTASSAVEQYRDGQYLGRYDTKSTLYKLNSGVAMVN